MATVSTSLALYKQPEIVVMERLDTTKAMRQAYDFRERLFEMMGTFMTEVQFNFPSALESFLKEMSSMMHTLTGEVKKLTELLQAASAGGGAGGAVGGKAEEAVKEAAEKADPGKSSKLVGFVKSVASSNTLSAVMKQAKSAMSASMEEQQLANTFKARTGNDQVGAAMFAKFKKEALAAGQDVSQSLKSTLSFLPVAQNTNQLSKMNTMAQRLSVGGGSTLDQSSSALKDAMTGDTGALEKNFNVSKADVSKYKLDSLGKKGDIDGFLKAFDQLLEKQKMGQAAYDKMMASPANQLQALKNNLKGSMAEAGQGAVTALLPLMQLLNTAFQSGKFQPYFDAFASAIRGVAMIFSTLVQTALALSNVIQAHWPLISNILIAIGAAVVTYLIPQLWAMIPPLFAALPPLFAQVLAWLAINWPILLVAAAIGAVIFILLQCGVTAAQIVGAIAGSFMVLVGVVWNIVAVIWNYFVSLAEFLVNLFIDPIYAIQKRFYDLAMSWGLFAINMVRSAEDFAGGLMTSIISAINVALKGFNWLMSAVSSLFGKDFQPVQLLDEKNIHSVSDKMQGVLDKIEKPTSDKNVMDFSAAKMDQKNLKNEFDYGFNGGSDFMKNLSFKMPGADTSVLDNWNQNATINRVNEVGSINDTVDISSEDLKVMRDLAEMKSIQNFVSLTPTVQLTGDIHNNNTGDVEDMLGQIVEALQVEVSSSVSGVIA
ncbi:hypothetical protein ABE504_29360 [Paenibacillus oryzisoli]|uniref:hypothetical protein n=1 Tax=Paenibacillus oryzisoli TaxID=1850517 RepID=UPI003D2A71DF